MKTQNRITRLLAFAVIFLMSGCERDYNNPWDGKASLDPNSWAPQNLAIEDVSITEKKLTWTYTGDDRFEGFKLDRKAGNAEWQEAYQVLPKEARNWTDNQVIPDPSLSYSYRVYAFAGKYSSYHNTFSINATIPTPTNLQITPNSINSVTLNWDDNCNGEGGFKIDRKVNSGEWVKEFASVNANHTTFTDNSVNLGFNEYYYRIYGFFDQYNSDFIEEVASIKIGGTAFGGIVFYLTGNGGGLVCAPADQSTGAQWGCYGTTIGGTSTAVGAGSSNTAKIVAGCNTAGIAARICNDLVLNGYNDWFLPSKDELNLMYQNLKVAGSGGFASNFYWFSSEYNNDNAWLQHFASGYQTNLNKSYNYYVRAVRAF